MTPFQGFITVLCALIAVAGVIVSSILGYKQFKIKRQDELDSRNMQTLVDKAVDDLRREIMEVIEGVSVARSKEGADRFNTHAQALDKVDKRIEENSKQISELTELSKSMLTSVNSLNKSVASAVKSQKNTTYDRLLLVGKKALNAKSITISEKTNIRQLFDSYREMGGDDPYINTLMEECEKLTPIADKEQ